MNEINKGQTPASENEIPDVHFRGTISTNPQNLDEALALLKHSGQVHNEKSIMTVIKYLTVRHQQEKYGTAVRQEIVTLLAQIVVFNERNNPALAAKVREALKTFIS